MDNMCHRTSSDFIQTLPYLLQTWLVSELALLFSKPESSPFAVSHHATNSVTPPASLIFRSASLLKNRALTTIGISGILPLPSTFE